MGQPPSQWPQQQFSIPPPNYHQQQQLHHIQPLVQQPKAQLQRQDQQILIHKRQAPIQHLQVQALVQPPQPLLHLQPLEQKTISQPLQQQSSIPITVYQQQSLSTHEYIGQKSFSLTKLQPDDVASCAYPLGGSSIQGIETKNHVLGKRNIQDLVAQVDPQVKLDNNVTDILLEHVDSFIDSVIRQVCVLAKYRKSSTLEPKDLLLHLEKDLGLTVSGYSSRKKHQKTL